MRSSFYLPKITAAVFLLVGATLLVGCSQTRHRKDADREAYCMIAERNGDPRWLVSDVGIDLSPRSGYFDPYHPDCSPMPEDDPAAHRYMRCVDGKERWRHWQDYGVRAGLENPLWRQRLGEDTELSDAGAVKLNVESAVSLAYVPILPCTNARS